ncbi:MAG TPA: dual specificity protein phosphatase family protein [Solirubrobacteraceae bacterium]
MAGGHGAYPQTISTWFRTYGFADLDDTLTIGAYPLDSDDVAALQRVGIERVVNLVEDEEYAPGQRDEVVEAYRRAGIEEARLELVDYGGLQGDQLDAAVRTVSDALDHGARTYLHCRAGWQRSAAVAAGVIAARRGIDIDDALAQVQQMKPSADPLPHQREDLRRWWEGRQARAN